MGVPRRDRAGTRVRNGFDGSADEVVQIGVVHGDVVARPSAPVPDPAADGLAVVVRRQWSAEAAVRSLCRPEPLRLRWVPTRRPVACPAAPVVAGGDLDDLARLFTAADRRLVVLGGLGAGKTATALLLTLALLDRRLPGEPVPVLLSPSSWDPRGEHLEDWIVRRLETDYPALRNRRAHGRRAARRLVAEQRVVPLLDGLDELPPDLLAPALEGVHRAFGKGRPLVLTCRGDEYEDAVRAGGAALPSAAVVELEPVAAADAVEFLSASSPEAPRRWAPVLDRLLAEPASVVARSLATPLAVNLARTVYAGPDRDPAELADPDRFADPAAVERHLLGSLVTAVYGDPPAPSPRLVPLPASAGRYPADRARRWLGFLARNATGPSGRDIAWWRLPRPHLVVVPALSAPLLWAAVGEAATLAVGFAIGFAFTWLAGAVRRRAPLRHLLLAPAVLGTATWFVGYAYPAPPLSVAVTAAGLVLLVALASSGQRPPHRLAPRVRGRAGTIASRVLLTLLFAVGTATAALLVKGLRHPGEWWIPPALGVVAAAAVGLGTWLTAPPDAFSVPRPGRALRGDVVSTAVCVLAGAAAFQLPVLIAAVVLDRSVKAWQVVTALGFGLGTGLGCVIANASVLYAASLAWWALRGRLPWRLVRFLDDAHRRGVLRQTGAVYQFRHARLQHHLAEEREVPAPRR